jgi:hypothetical protein
MALQLYALRHALVDAGASERSVEKAAEEVVGYDNRIASLDTKLSTLTWMSGFNLVLTLGVLWRVLSH